MRMTRPLTILALLAILPAPVLGQSNTAVESAYTTFDSDTCRRTPGRDVEDYGSWLCRGYGDIRVRLAAGVSGMYGFLVVQPAGDPGRYDREVLLAAHHW
jgi:hypothetical protein